MPFQKKRLSEKFRIEKVKKHLKNSTFLFFIAKCRQAYIIKYILKNLQQNKLGFNARLCRNGAFN